MQNSNIVAFQVAGIQRMWRIGNILSEFSGVFSDIMRNIGPAKNVI